jgi:hypothetical protein
MRYLEVPAILIFAFVGCPVSGNTMAVPNIDIFAKQGSTSSCISDSDFQSAFGFKPVSKLSGDAHLRPLIRKFVTSSLGGEGPTASAADEWEIRRATARKCLIDALEKRVLAVDNQEMTFNQFMEAFQTELRAVDTCLMASPAPPLRAAADPKSPAISPADAATINAKQVRLLSERGTVWHAVSAFGTPQGKLRARRVHQPICVTCSCRQVRRVGG